MMMYVSNYKYSIICNYVLIWISNDFFINEIKTFTFASIAETNETVIVFRWIRPMHSNQINYEGRKTLTLNCLFVLYQYCCVWYNEGTG